MISVDLRLFVTVFCILCGAGCMTAVEGAHLNREIAAVRPRLYELARLEAERQQQTIELQKTLEQANVLLTSRAADIVEKEAKAETDIVALQTEVDRVDREVQQAAKQRAEAQNHFEIRIAALEESAAKILDKVAPLLPDDKETLWGQAVERTKSGQTSQGRHFYRVFIQRFPADPRASQAYLAVGLTFMSEKQFPNAAAEFQRLLAVYPQSPEVPEAMWQLSRAFIQLHFCTDARALLGDLVKRYPKSAPAAEAQKEMKSLKRLPRSVCTS